MELVNMLEELAMEPNIVIGLISGCEGGQLWAWKSGKW